MDPRSSRIQSSFQGLHLIDHNTCSLHVSELPSPFLWQQHPSLFLYLARHAYLFSPRAHLKLNISWNWGALSLLKLMNPMRPLHHYWQHLAALPSSLLVLDSASANSSCRFSLHTICGADFYTFTLMTKRHKWHYVGFALLLYCTFNFFFSFFILLVTTTMISLQYCRLWIWFLFILLLIILRIAHFTVSFLNLVHLDWSSLCAVFRPFISVSQVRSNHCFSFAPSDLLSMYAYCCLPPCLFWLYHWEAPIGKLGTLKG